MKYSPIPWILHQLSSPPGRNIYNVKYSPIPWILHQLSSPPGRYIYNVKYSPIPGILQLSSPLRRKNIYPNSGEVGNCTNYQLSSQPGRKCIYIYIMSDEIWNVHQFYEYCTKWLPHQEGIYIYNEWWSLKYLPIPWTLQHLLLTIYFLTVLLFAAAPFICWLWVRLGLTVMVLFACICSRIILRMLLWIIFGPFDVLFFCFFFLLVVHSLNSYQAPYRAPDIPTNHL